MPEKGLLITIADHFKNINAFFGFASWIGVGVGAVVAAATLVLKYLDLIADKDRVIYVLLYIVFAQLLFWTLLSIIIYLMRKIRKAEPISDAQFRIGAKKILLAWLDMSRSSAECDSRIFDYLYLYRLADEKAEGPALNLVEQQIVELLSDAIRIFKILTGDDCAIAIKCAIPKSDSLQTLHRDKTSQENRGGERDKLLASLSANKPMDEIAAGRMPFYMKDDLESAFQMGEYTNSRTDWRKYYNATIVHPINIRSGTRKTKSTPSLENLVFMICVDNKKGNFENGFSLDVARYVANRVSPLLYRAVMLKFLAA